MHISIAKNPKGKPWETNDFHTVEVITHADLSKRICFSPWSPIVWKDGKRNTDNFLSSDFLVLDFDDGKWTLESAKDYLTKNRLTGIIGTTKSHQKPKNGVICDRFRLVVPWEKSLNSYAVYRQNVERIMQQVPADRACKDGGRVFQPCKEIIFSHRGSRLEWTPFMAVKCRGVSPDLASTGKLPKWLEMMIDEAPPAGVRNKHCFKIACWLSRYGYSESDCITMVLSNPADLPEREKTQAAKSGFRAGKKKTH